MELGTNIKIFKRLINILKRTGMIRMLLGFVIFCFAAAFILFQIEETLPTLGDALWYCFVASMTIGFGDLVAVSTAGRIITVLVCIYGVVITAMIPGVVVSYYMEFLKIKENETISLFFEKLEHLPELSHDEIVELSEKIKKFNKK